MVENFRQKSFEDEYADEAKVNSDLRRALELLDDAGRAHQSNDIDQAIELYKESIAFYPTADAHTYLGWMYSFQGRIEEAQKSFEKAIETSDGFGQRVDHPEDLHAAIKRGLEAVRDGTPALINVITKGRV